MKWDREDVRVDFVEELTEVGVGTVQIDTPAGRIFVMGEPRFDGRTLVVSGVHMHGAGLGANGFGIAALRALADALLEEMDCDVLVVEGALRTTGASPGSPQRPIRLYRRPRA